MFDLFKSKPIKLLNILSNEVTTTEDEKIFREYVVDSYKNQNYSVWDHTSDTREENKSINIIAKKNRDIMLIHSQLATKNISIEDLKKFEIERNNFIIKNPIFEDYNITLRYSLRGFFLNEDAFWYMQENIKSISYQIIKPN